MANITSYRIGNFATYEGKVVTVNFAGTKHANYLIPLTLCEYNLKRCGFKSFMNGNEFRVYCFDVTDNEGVFVYCHNWKPIRIVWLGQEIEHLRKINELQNFIEDLILEEINLVNAL